MSHAPHPQMQAILATMRAAPLPPFETMPIAAARALFEETHGRMNVPLPECSARDLVLGGVACQLLNEAAGPGLIVYVHGGGWTFGSPASHQRCARLLAAGLDCLRDDTLILSGKLAAAGVRYRLDVIPGVVHGFLQMSALLHPARAAIATIADAIRKSLNRE
jgi:acetyl esterase/lipase